MSTRRATRSDLDALVSLFDGYRVFYEEEPDPALVRRFLSERLTTGDTVLLLAEREGRVLGFVHLFPIFSSTRCRRLWLLNDLFVDPSARVRGIGRELMAAAEAFAMETGACGLELATAHSNVTAQRLYQSMGWTMDSVFRHYERTLPSPPSAT